MHKESGTRLLDSVNEEKSVGRLHEYKTDVVSVFENGFDCSR